MYPGIHAIILAAGKGTRMKSKQAKVLHQLFFRPMLHHVLAGIAELKLAGCSVIVGHQREEVIAALEGYAALPVIQEQQNGTGHAVLCAEDACAQASQILILCGDTPLIQSRRLKAMIESHAQHNPILTLMTTSLDEPFGYGRIIKSGEGRVEAIVEEKDASPAQRGIHDINAGIYLAERNFLFTALKQVDANNTQGEIYLTDIVAIARRQGLAVQAYEHPQATDVLGVNSRLELAQAQMVLQQRRNQELMLAGVTMLAPTSTLVSPDCTIGEDCILEGQVRLSGASRLGRDCLVEQGVVLDACQVGEGAVIGANSVLRHCRIAPQARIAPLTRLFHNQIAEEYME